MQPAIIPLPLPTERTTYSDDAAHQRFVTADALEIHWYVTYVLWDCSTEYMVNCGMPTATDVNQWISWLSSRPDSQRSEIIDTIQSCSDYIGTTDAGSVGVFEANGK